MYSAIERGMLTLDLGKQTGWTILHDGIVQSGSKSFHVSRFSGGGMQFLNFRNWLCVQRRQVCSVGGRPTRIKVEVL